MAFIALLKKPRTRVIIQEDQDDQRATSSALNGVKAFYQQTRRAALAGLVITLILGASKLAGGWFGHSLALLSDSLHSFGDALSSASILVAFWWAEIPADPEHPYGHTRLESIAALIVALLLLQSGLWIGWEVVHSWEERSHLPDWYTLLIAFASVVLNVGLNRYSLWVARRTGSKSIEAQAWDQCLDILGSLVVLLSLALSFWGPPGWSQIDKIAAFAIAGLILWVGGRLLWESVQDLMDRQAEPELLDQIRQLALNIPGVQGVEKLRVRKTGLEYLVDIHVEVDPQVSVMRGHEIGHRVKDCLRARVVGIKDVLVHIEPAPSRERPEPPILSTPSQPDAVP